jgi:hypothetical protein
MSKGTKKWLKVGGGVALGIGAVYFAAGVAYINWHGYPFWSTTVGTAPGPWDFKASDAPPDQRPHWWAYLVGRRTAGATLSFNTNPGDVANYPAPLAPNYGTN